MIQELTIETSLLVNVSHYLGETPLWSQTEQRLYWVSVEQPSAVLAWSPQSDTPQQWPMPDRVGGIALKRGGGLLVVLARGIYDFDPASGALRLRTASPLPTHVKLHECTTDRQGRLWVGAYDHRFSPHWRDPGGGAFFRLDGDRLTPVVQGITIANGFAFSPDGRVFYAADSVTRGVDAYDFDPDSGTVSGKRRFLDVPPSAGFIDGATVDADGGYWLSLMYGSALRRYLPDGSLDCTLRLPFSSPTKAIFGGSDFKTLFITTTRMHLGTETPAGFDNNGPVFSCRPGFRGLADTPVND